MAFFDGGDGANQRVWNLPSKGAAFRDLLRHPVVRTLARHVLDGDYCLSSHTANIAGPGGAAMGLHSDQGYTPRDDRHAADDERDVDARRLHRRERGHPPRARLAPAAGRAAAATRPVETVAGVGPAGTALVFDGRVWHGTGANTTADEHALRRAHVLLPAVDAAAGELHAVDPPRRAGRPPTTSSGRCSACASWRTLGGVRVRGARARRGRDRLPHRRLRGPPRAPDRRAAPLTVGGAAPFAVLLRLRCGQRTAASPKTGTARRARPERSLPLRGHQRAVDELLELAADRVRARRQQLGQEHHREVVDGVDPVARARGPAPAVVADVAGDLGLDGVDRDADTEPEADAVERRLGEQRATDRR